jgi:polyferredoxin
MSANDKGIVNHIRRLLGRLSIRYLVQGLFFLWVFLMAFQFRDFVLSLSGPLEAPPAYRPPSVEAFLPISSLMSLTYFIKTGLANRVHPAGLVIFSLTLLGAIVIRNGFCGWVCPIGSISEVLYKSGSIILGKNLSLPLWLDRGLRGVKYLLLVFFLYIILPMSAEDLGRFIHGPYNRIADVKMYFFFSQISTLALVILLALAFFSLFIKHFWCRYGCPYGALLGLLSRFSPFHIQRNADRCLGCGSCDRTCPNSISVSQMTHIRSEECRACFSCLEACPRRDVLHFGTGHILRTVPTAAYALVILLIFLGLPLVFSALGYWESETPPFLYRHLFQILTQISHPTVSGPGAG